MNSNSLLDELLAQVRSLVMRSPRDPRDASVSPAAVKVFSGEQASSGLGNIHSGTDQQQALHPSLSQSHAGEHLYLLDCEKLLTWAGDHWDSQHELEAVCDAFRHNWKQWRTQYHIAWSGPDRFFECQERLFELRRLAEEKKAEELQDDDNEDLPGANTPERQSLPENTSAITAYATLMENVLLNWNERSELLIMAKTLRLNLNEWAMTLPSGLRPRRILEWIQMRLHALLPTLDVVRRSNATETRQADPRHSALPGCPEWPDEAGKPASIALGSDTFFHSTGMLRFMGYRVGKVSDLTPQRRRAILTYVLKGVLPQVNDRHYMKDWGKPNTGRRLRKLANSLASFARNARRKRGKNWRQAINDWEADLEFLRTRYYDRRHRDWKWPHTVRRGKR
jgi:hypothetical protein